MTGIEYLRVLRALGCLPMSAEGRHPEASNSEIRRWLEQGAVEINGARIRPDQEMPDLVVSLVFFPGGKRRTTMMGYA